MMGRKWTQDDIITYNIKVVYQDLMTFFGMTDLPPANVESDALVAKDLASAQGYWTSNMLFHMDYVTDPDNRESGTIDFVREVFHLLHYANTTQNRVVMVRWKLRYLATQGKHPQVDICILDDSNVISLVVKVHRNLPGFNPEARLISEAIAAFENNNVRCKERLGITPLAGMVMPGIVMDGTTPTFYKILVTSELVRAIKSGNQPKQETIVHAYRPEVPRPEEGMRPLDNRRIILSAFEAFRQFL